MSSGDKIVGFWRKQIPTVYIPCLVFSLGWFVLGFLQNGMSNWSINLIKLVICGFSVYYFIALIVQLYAVTPWLLRFNNWGGVIVTAIITALSILLTTYMMEIEGRSFPLILYAGPMFSWVFYFMVGIWYSAHSRHYSLWSAILLIIVGLLGSVIEARYYLSINSPGIGVIKLSAFIYSTGVLMLLFSEKVEKLYSTNKYTRVILFIGEISFGIYLLHMYLRNLVGHLHIHSWIFEWAMTLVVTVLLIVIAKKIFPANLIRKYFGIR